jgi:hypothetical protein
MVEQFEIYFEQVEIMRYPRLFRLAGSACPPRTTQGTDETAPADAEAAAGCDEGLRADDLETVGASSEFPMLVDLRPFVRSWAVIRAPAGFGVGAGDPFETNREPKERNVVRWRRTVVSGQLYVPWRGRHRWCENGAWLPATPAFTWS